MHFARFDVEYQMELVTSLFLFLQCVCLFYSKEYLNTCCYLVICSSSM